MSQINSNTKDDFQVVFLLSCFVGHPVCYSNRLSSTIGGNRENGLIMHDEKCRKFKNKTKLFYIS